MAKYLIEGRYNAAGAKGLAHDGGTGRRAAISKMIEGMGGKLESLYFAFGDIDLYAVVDLPDSASAAAMSLAVNQGGAATAKIVVLITPEEMDKAGKVSVKYKPPGH
jgi:uncharacterized protein with GYD domain